MNTLAPSVLNRSFFHVIRTTIRAWMSSNFGQIRQLTTELAALEHLVTRELAALERLNINVSIFLACF